MAVRELKQRVTRMEGEATQLKQQIVQVAPLTGNWLDDINGGIR